MQLPFDLKSIKPGEFAYLTRRKLANKSGEEAGEIVLWKRRGEVESSYMLRCPFCGEEQQGKILLEKRPYRVKCSKCEKTINLPKLIDEAKKESKKKESG